MILRYFSPIARLNRRLIRARRRMEKHLDLYMIAQAEVNELTLDKKHKMHTAVAP